MGEQWKSSRSEHQYVHRRYYYSNSRSRRLFFQLNLCLSFGKVPKNLEGDKYYKNLKMTVKIVQKTKNVSSLENRLFKNDCFWQFTESKLKFPILGFMKKLLIDSRITIN